MGDAWPKKEIYTATQNGVLGDPNYALAANGKAYLVAITDLLVRFIQEHKHIQTKSTKS